MNARVFRNGKVDFDPVQIDATTAMIQAVHRKGRDMDEKWGTGRLPALVPIEWAERFGRQKAKMSVASHQFDEEEIRRHGEAMIRAYDKLDELAMQAGHRPGPPDVWEFMAGDELILLCRDISRVRQARELAAGRKCQVWSLDEIANVIRAHPALAAAKDAFPGSTVESIRPAIPWSDLDDELPPTLAA